MTFIIEMILLGIAAGLISGALGLGGGIVMVPALLVFVPGMDAHTAKGTSLLLIAFIALINAWRLGKHLEQRPWSLAGRLAAGAIMGGYLGAWLTTLVSEFALLAIYIGLLAVLAGQLFRTASQPEPRDDQQRAWWHSPLLGALSGAAGGATGTGGGLILVPLALQAGLATNKNVTVLSNMVMVVIAAAGSVAHLRATPTLELPWTFGHVNFLAVPWVFMGAQAGAAAGRRLNRKLTLRARRIILAVLLLLIVASLLPRMV